MTVGKHAEAPALDGLPEQVGARLKRLREQRRITLTALATTTGISKSTLSRLETGQRRQPEGMQAWKIVIPATKVTPEPREHDGHEWIYVLSGRMRLVLGDQDWVLGPGEVAEFDTQVPHWFGSTGDGPAEILSIFSRPGEQMTVRTVKR
jgi:quercetin dioxygenase-like cupin family protein